MQKIKYLLLTVLLMFPVILSAGTYDVEVNKANNLLNKENFVHTYEKYIVHGSDIKFEFSNNVNKTNTSFTKGGFISMDEFNLTKVRNASYLFEGIEFWTLSTNGSNVYAITYNDINTAKSKSSSYSGRATEFVNPTVTVHGEGKLNNPWTFDSIYKVSAKVDTRYATIESGNNAYVKGGCTNAECTARIKIVEKTGNRYIANDCDGLYDDTTKTLTVNNIKRDTVCNVTFGKGLYIVTLNKGTPNKIYLKYGENYYKEFQTKNIIRSIESVEPKTGYTFIGYFYNGHKIINGLKEPNSSDNKKILYESVTGKYITSDVTLEPTWEANKYKVEFDCNGGSVEPQTQIATYDQSFTLTSTVCQRGGYIQTGWNTASDGSGESWTTSNKTNVIWKIPNHVKLYAVWSECPAGTYSPTSSNECILCTVGDYCPKRSPNPTKCPDGYTSETGAININKCYLTISAGKYLGTANTTTQTECAKGTYKESHRVYYGDTSSCTNCPEGYRDGTSINNKTSESVCLKSVAAGYYIKNAKDKDATVCANGYYNPTHTKTYGQTSSCTQCPEGYRDGTAVANKTAQNTCLKNVAAGYYIKTANDKDATVCGNGYYSTAHSKTYGQTSSCSQCPEGYRDGTAVGNKTSQSVCLKNVVAGYYIKTANDKDATVCGTGTYSTAHSKTYGQTSSCSQCPEGYRDGTAVGNKTSQSVCLKNVAAGYYIKTANDKNATACAAGTSSTAHSKTYGQTSSCSQCPEGTYNTTTGNGSCTPCENGYYCGGGTDRHGCPAGTKGTGTGKSTLANGCTTCAAGTYNTGTGNTTCTDCPAGSYCTNGAKTPCPSGQWSNGGASTCFSKCSSVTYKQTTTCSKECGGGKYKREAYSAYDASYRCSGSDDWGGADCNTRGCCSSTTTKYSDWSACSKKCGGGEKSRHVYSKSNYDGSTCSSGWEYQACNDQACCSSMTDWTYHSAYDTECSVKCGGGYMKRVQVYKKYSTYDSSVVCDSKESYVNGKQCNTMSCCSDVNESWSCTAWVDSTSCTKTCGGGTKQQSRTCYKYSAIDETTVCQSQPGNRTVNCNTQACGGGCFLAETKVRTMFGYKDIDKIEVGDYVLSYNLYGKVKQFKKVTYKFIFEDKDEKLYTLTFDNKEEMQLTHEHNVYIVRGNEYDHLAAQDLNIGDTVIDSKGEKHKITNITHKAIKNTVYNLEIEDNHNFYVTENEILVHNARRLTGIQIPDKHY